MGGAAPIIGLGLQGVGMLTGGGGGTQYSPDPRAKYEADLMALKQAKINAEQQKQLIEAQTESANQFAQFNLDQQLLQFQKEKEYYDSYLQNAYLNNLATLEREQLNKDIQTQAQSVQLDMQRKQVEQQFNTQLTDISRTKNENAQALRLARMSSDIQQRSLYANNELDLRQLQIQQEGLNLARANLLQSDSEARQSLSQQQAGIYNQQGQLDVSRAGVGAQEAQARGQAELEQGGRFNQLLRQFAGNEKTYNQLQNQLQARGLLEGSGNLQEALYNNLDTETNLRESQALYGQQLGNATVNAGLANAGLDVQQAGLNTAQAFQNLQGGNIDRRLGMGLRGNELENQGLGVSRGRQRQQFMQGLEQLSLGNEQDLLKYQLLPNLRLADQEQAARFAQAMGLTDNDLQTLLTQVDYNQDSMMRNRAIQSNQMAYNTAGETLQSDLNRQQQAAQAGYASDISANQLDKSAAIANLLSSQHGLLSSIGAGLSQGYPSGGGGGFDIAGLGGLLSQAAKMFGGGLGGNRTTNSPYQLYNQSYPTQTGNYYNPNQYDFSNPQTSNIKGLF